jgi:CheY-like chemotaxis protein
VALTASAFQEDRAAVLAAGCDDIVSKPIEEDRLFAVMEQQLDLRLHREASVTTTSVAAATDISLLPEEIRRQLCVAATALDRKAALACVARIRGTHPAEAAAIVALVEEFRYDILLKHCS